jgi:hypothetical protein
MDTDRDKPLDHRLRFFDVFEHAAKDGDRRRNGGQHGKWSSVEITDDRPSTSIDKVRGYVGAIGREVPFELPSSGAKLEDSGA